MQNEIIDKIITIDEYFQNPNQYNHLFEITEQAPLEIIWQEHEIFTLGGNLMIGYLNLSEQNTDQIEFHPFPEWVIKIFQPSKKPGKAYAIFPNLSKEEIATYTNLSYYERNRIAKETAQSLKPMDFIAIQYVDGLCIKIPAHVPHYFLSVINEGEDVPFMVVFEPKVPILEYVLKNDSNTEMIPLNFRLSIG